MSKLVVDACLEFVNDKGLIAFVDISGGDVYNDDSKDKTSTFAASYKVSFEGADIFSIKCHGAYPAYATGYTLTVNGVDYKFKMNPDGSFLADVVRLFTDCIRLKNLMTGGKERGSLQYLQKMKNEVSGHHK